MAHFDASMTPEEIKAAKMKTVLKVTIILAAVTLVEFALAFAWPDGSSRFILNILFVALTIVKAGYIIMEFMHLGHETSLLKFVILFPMLFLVWLCVALFVEGQAILDAFLNW
ncbi:MULTISPECIES: cytochrome C oxidase subunit IV family protein [Flammeovirga]|uniref:Cytochrome C oxidase subunit IV family protein n=1 Tax=Flammeovirga agarivorans TaxID=2726742 RepID=A0A7X8SLG7_9BACT|nr:MULTISPECIES: cytochrome C oxidase subunit IV family protein [Flammeovirga]NLR92333.1 cytochrome C oxidase subunit IV family protein [Flammeovirga agarivorans]